MPRLIDAKPLMQSGWHLVKTGESNRFLASMSLADVPTVDAVEVVHGCWVNNKNDYPECDKCGYMPQYDPMIDDIWYSPYCPKCGARMMDGDGNG